MNVVESYMLPCGILGILISLGISLGLRRMYGTSRVLGRATEFHHHPSAERIPRLGGICIVGGFLAVCIAALFIHQGTPLRSLKFWAIAGCSLGMFTVGIIDDFRALGAKRKLIFQILLAMMAYFSGIRIEQFKMPFLSETIPLQQWGFLVTVLWLVAMTNLINLIDGIDGLAGGIGVLMMGLLAWVGFSLEGGFYTLLCVGILGALLGFLRFNFPPARIYMGDGGAYFIGFFIGLISIETSNKGTVAAALTAPLLALALPIIDTSLALLRRASKGLPLFRPDLDHIHHRMMGRNQNKTRTVLTLYAFSMIAMGFAIAIFISSGRYVPVLIGAAAVVLVSALRYLSLIPSLKSAWPILRNHLRLRRHSRYLLGLTASLEMEAENCDSLDHLWTNYEILAGKAGLDRIRVRLNGTERTWHGQELESSHWYRRHGSPNSHHMELEFYCRKSRFAEDEFEHVTNLAAEAWHKAVSRWTMTNRPPSSLTSGAPEASGNYRFETAPNFVTDLAPRKTR